MNPSPVGYSSLTAMNFIILLINKAGTESTTLKVCKHFTSELMDRIILHLREKHTHALLKPLFSPQSIGMTRMLLFVWFFYHLQGLQRNGTDSFHQLSRQGETTLL